MSNHLALLRIIRLKATSNRPHSNSRQPHPVYLSQNRHLRFWIAEFHSTIRHISHSPSPLHRQYEAIYKQAAKPSITPTKSPDCGKPHATNNTIR
ncbi:MAG: hypothetical protein LBJ00_09475 [Planctomycetaceae bacterium]|nr:hypothetical protein [Planctomycetaceae bacterium]